MMFKKKEAKVAMGAPAPKKKKIERPVANVGKAVKMAVMASEKKDSKQDAKREKEVVKKVAKLGKKA